MKRKINLVGTGTLTVSLPAKWVEDHHLKKGDELEVKHNHSEIIFSLTKKQKENKEISLNIDQFNRYLLARYLESLYINNYDRITFIYSKTEIYDDKVNKNINLKSFINKLKNRFIGMEIVSQTSTSTELKVFIINKEETPRKIEKRIYFLLKETFDELINSINHHHKEFHQNIYEHHDNITKFISYYLRALEESDKGEEEKKQLFSLYMIIDKMIDKFRHVSEMIDKHGTSEKVKKYLKEIFSLVEELFLALHKEEINQELVAKRYKLVQKIGKEDFSLAELKVISEVKIFLDVINDFCRTIIVKDLAKKV